MNIIGVVDCNNFYASCERVFNPKLEKRPVVVLSNNDGCVIARSNEAKALGIKMGAPAFQHQYIFKTCNVAVYSANFPLYADMSHRVMQVLMQFVPRIEIYSIDEAFLSFEEVSYTDVEKLAKKINKTVKTWTGIPVSIGIGNTKTLAKVANDIAKRNPQYEGVVSFHGSRDTDYFLHKVDVSDVWGIGRSLTKFLYANNIYTALQLKHCDDTWVKKHMTISGLKTVYELRGIPCVTLEDVPPAKKTIISSKSFRHSVSTLPELKESVAAFISRAAEKLREEKLLASCVHVFIITNRHKNTDRQYNNSFFVHLSQPTDYTPTLIKYAFYILEKIYRSGYRYKKASVMLSNLSANTEQQMNLFLPAKKLSQRTRIMQIMDKLNSYWGRDTVRFAAEGLKSSGWRQKPQYISQRYTTRWNELLKIRV